MVQAKRRTGDTGEKAVALFLVEQGYAIVATNVRWIGGEIDLIASRDQLIAFVEVKTRSQSSHFPLSSVVTPLKQQKIIKTALRFVSQHNICDMILRFDIALVMLNSSTNPIIDYIENAFTDPEER
jgi:putative endonuclease